MHSPEEVEDANELMFRILFPKDAEMAHVVTKEQYECPFTGKRFGSMDALVKAAIPTLIGWKEGELERKKQNAEREAVMAESDRHRQQLIDAISVFRWENDTWN